MAEVNETRLMSYLLGELSEAEETQLEQQYLQDEALHQELLLAEDELIESFLRNELPPEKRRRFESHFLASPARRERLESARVMLRAINTEAPSLASDRRLMTSPGLTGLVSSFLAHRIPVTALAATVLLLGAGLALLTLRLQTAMEQFRAERASWLQQQEDLKRQLAQHQGAPTTGSELPHRIPSSEGGRSSRRGGSTAATDPLPQQASSPLRLTSAVLTHGQAREAGDLKRVVLSAESHLLLLYLVLPETANMRSYRAAIKTDEGRALWTQINLPLAAIGGKRSAALLVESRLLKPGDYVVTLLGPNSAGQKQELADYVLRVVKTI